MNQNFLENQKIQGINRDCLKYLASWGAVFLFIIQSFQPPTVPANMPEKYSCFICDLKHKSQGYQYVKQIKTEREKRLKEKLRYSGERMSDTFQAVYTQRERERERGDS